MCSIENFTEEDDNRAYHQNIRNRCGEIFFEEDKLKYYCLFCQEDFGKISNFINHLYKSHLFMDPPLFEEEKSQQLDNDSATIDEIKYDPNKSYLIDQLDENSDAFCLMEKSEDPKFVTKQDTEADRSTNNSQIDNDLSEFNEIGENLFNDCKVEIIQNEMNREENSKPDIEIKKYQCEICLKILSSDRSLKRHHLTHENIKNGRSNVVNKYSFPRGEDDKFHCNLCPNAYSRLDSLRRHIKRHWGSTHAKCDICSKILSSKVHLKAHMRVHTGERPHKCDHCPAAFADRTNFDRHLRIHLGDKRYNCDYCDKTFIQRSEKKIHERMVHTKERPYQCEICGRKFFNGVSLNDHKRRHTNTRPCECEICGKRFYNRKLLNDHKISHSTEKPFTCDICYAKFARRKALRQHVKIHSNVKEYVCTICNKAFAQNAGLYSHMKSHTGNPQTTNNVTS